MTNRITTAWLLTAAVVILCWGNTAMAQEKKEHAMDGHIVKVEDDKLTMVGEDKKEVTHTVPKEAKVTLDCRKPSSKT